MSRYVCWPFLLAADARGLKGGRACGCLSCALIPFRFSTLVNRGSGTGPFNLCVYAYVLFLEEGVSAFIRFFERCMTLKTENHFINIVVLKLEHVTESSPGGLVKQGLLDPTSTVSDSSLG